MASFTTTLSATRSPLTDITCILYSSSFSNGEPPTPTKTPTNSSFGESFLRTPRFESSFDDPRVTWDTADPFGSSPDLSKAKRTILEATAALGDSLALEGDRDTEAEDKFWNYSHKPVSRPTASVHSQFAPSPAPSSGNRSAASMQTPPPTSTVKRKPPQFILPGVKEAMASNRKTKTPMSRRIAPATTTTPGQAAQPSPNFFQSLQFSPDLFATPTPGSMPMPQTAPAMPQHKLFWDPDHTNGNMDLSHTFSDPFAPTQNHGFDFGLSVPPQQGASDTGLSLFGMPSLDQHTDLDTALFPVPFTASPRPPVTHNEDPSLFLSSPARRFGSDVAVAGSSAMRPQRRQPYSHQEQEARRERELEHAHKARARLVSPTRQESRKRASPAPERQQPGLKRSSTHSGISGQPLGRRLSGASHESNRNMGLSHTTSRGGRTSPLKRSVHAHDLSSTKLRPSLSFKIDSSGRATTEPVVVARPGSPLKKSAAQLELEELSTESEDDMDGAEFSFAQSRNASFNFVEPDVHKPRYMRDRSGSGSVSSNSIYQPSRPDSRHDYLRRSTKRDSNGLGLSRISDVSSAPGSDAGTIPEEEDTGDAAQMLRLAREKSRAAKQNQSWSQSFAALRSSPPSFHGHSYGDRRLATSPTTMTDPDIATPTPSTERVGRGSTTRCVCQSLENGGHLMIQW